MYRVSIFFLVLFSDYSLAGYSCKGNVSYWGVHSNHYLHVNNGYGVKALCSLNLDSEKDYCKGWMSMIMSAQARNVPLKIYFSDSTGKQSSAENCRAVENWAIPTDRAYFVALEK